MSRFSIVLWIASVMLLTGMPGSFAPRQAYDLVVANVTLIDGTGAPARSGVNIYVRDGRIAAVTPEPLGDGAAVVIDGAGKYLMPGLIDAHAHPFPIDANFPRFIHYGVTSILITGCSDCTDENLARARALGADDEAAAPRVFHTSQHFTMEGRHPVKTYPEGNWVEGESVYYLREAGDAELFVEAVADQPIVGIKLTIEDGPMPPFVEMIPPELVVAVVEAAHARDLEVFAHVSTMEALRIAEAAGVDHLIHFVGLDVDWQQDAATIERLRERDASWVTTLMIAKSFFYPAHPAWLDEVEATGVFEPEEISRLRAGLSPAAALDVLRRRYGTSDPTLEEAIRPQLEDLRVLHEQGFNLVVGTDTGNRFIFPGLSVHEEMELLARGFAPSEIIPMATRNAAEMLGALDEVGTLELGKRADMLLLDEDPLDDIGHTQSIDTVFKSGRPQLRIPGAGD